MEVIRRRRHEDDTRRGRHEDTRSGGHDRNIRRGGQKKDMRRSRRGHVEDKKGGQNKKDIMR